MSVFIRKIIKNKKETVSFKQIIYLMSLIAPKNYVSLNKYTPDYYVKIRSMIF